jgi:hypothetical protein
VCQDALLDANFAFKGGEVELLFGFYKDGVLRCCPRSGEFYGEFEP